MLDEPVHDISELDLVSEHPLHELFEASEAMEGLGLFNEQLVEALRHKLDKLFESTTGLTASTLEAEQSGQQINPYCGYIFCQGDVIYRCKDCAIDETCVLCADCFQETDHTGHRVTYSVSKGPGGSCDCGELESWKINLTCPSHQATLLESSDSSYPVPEKNLVAFFAKCIRVTFEQINDNLDPGVLLGAPALPEEEEKTIGALVLYNDQVHSFGTVIKVLEKFENQYSQPLDWNGYKIAEIVDREGVAILLSSKDHNQRAISRCSRLISSTGLDAQYHQLKRMLKLITSSIVLQWIADLSGSNNLSIRTAIFLALTRKYGADQACPLETFFQLDSKLFKGQRKAMNKTLTACSLFFTPHKLVIASHLTKQLPFIFKQYCQEEREPELSIVHFYVQIYTISSVLVHLFKHYSLLSIVLDTLYDVLAVDNQQGHGATHLMINSKMFMITSLINFILDDPMVLEQQLIIAEPTSWDLWLKLLRATSLFDLQIRQTTNHVEYENPYYFGYFTFADELTSLSELYVKHLIFAKDIGLVKRYIDALCPAISIKAESLLDQYNLPQKFTFLHPEWCAIWLLFCSIFNIVGLKDYKQHFLEYSSFLKIYMDNVLIIFKAISAIRIGLWVLNGTLLKYRTIVFTLPAYKQAFINTHIGILKLAAIALEPSEWISGIAESLGLELLLTVDTDQQLCANLLDEYANILLLTIFGNHLLELNSTTAVKEALVATLCLGPLNYKELKAVLSEPITDHEKFQEILDQVATVVSQPPAQQFITSSQLELKSEYIKLYNPYFWTYLAAERETSREYMTKRHGFKLDAAFFTSLSTQPSLSYQELTLLEPVLCTKQFFQSILAPIMTCKHVKNSTLETMLVITGLLLSLSSEKQEIQDMIESFLTEFETTRKLDSEPQSILDAVREAYFPTDTKMTNQSSSKLLDENSKKELIKLKQRKAIESFQAKQRQFRDANLEAIHSLQTTITSTHGSLESKSGLSPTMSPHEVIMSISGTCIVCQESADASSGPYGVLASLQFSDVGKDVQIINEPDIWNNHSNSDSKVALSGCQHLVHLKCFVIFSNQNSLASQTCPLCASYCNLVLAAVPIYYPNLSITAEEINQTFQKSNQISQLVPYQFNDFDINTVVIPDNFALNVATDIIFQCTKVNKRTMKRFLPQEESFYTVFLQCFVHTAKATAEIVEFPSDFSKAIESLRLLKEFLTVYGFLGSEVEERLAWSTSMEALLKHLSLNPSQTKPDSDSTLLSKDFCAFRLFVHSLLFDVKLSLNLPRVLKFIKFICFIQLRTILVYYMRRLSDGIIAPSDPTTSTRFTDTEVKTIIAALGAKAKEFPIAPMHILHNADKAIFYHEVEARFARFLRQCSVVMTVWYGQAFSLCNLADPFSLDQLCRHLNLPTLLFNICEELACISVDQAAYPSVYNLPISNYTPQAEPFQLTPLKERYDLQLVNAAGYKCAVSEKRSINPALCLICGVNLCINSYCCTRGEIGACSRHLSEHGNTSGLYLILEAGCILVLTKQSAILLPAPFTDIHDQTDINLTNGNLLYFRPSRYEEFRRLWLTHGIPSFISMKSKIDNGRVFGEDDASAF